ncbi:MAG: ATP-binding protein [Flavobacteriales bacterium]|jgi:two-component system, sensor histidine kinase LadS|nr:ATP-binding protein [Flavobacteriales bacterium]MDP4717092.1 ATP-binding protein [Flavobacteriales bacterium]MDP4731707.1 ATP-binding protein [Flavobacteriales bacterium]MDP4819079.1 ATP-binding protein [Flavobacteriales bacterium]MDP4951584.1 ATP-binding protein [Flavobacteriales bacterium]
MRLSLTILLSIAVSIGCAQKELNFYVGEQMSAFPTGTKCWVDTSSIISFDYYKQNEEKFSSNLPVELSNISGKLWILIPIDSLISKDSPFVVLTNPHINFVSVWWLDEQQNIIKECRPTGDHYAFNSREIHTSSLTFQNPNLSKSKFILISADKRNEAFNLNIHFTKLKFIENRIAQETALFGWLIGIVAVIFIITWVLFSFARDTIYLYYGGYLFFMLCYSFADFSLWHWILAFNTPRNIDFIRPITLAASFIFFVFFILRALSIKVNFPKSYKVLRIGFLAFIAYVVIAICIYVLTQNSGIKFYGILISHYLQRGLLIILIITIIQATIKKTPFALLVSISLALFLGVHLVNYFFENGVLPDRLIFQHFLPIVYTIDCLVMSVIIARTFLRFQKKSLDLSNEILLQNIDFQNKLNEVKEKDLTRISQYLHDNIGAEISAMRYELEALKSNPNQSDALDRLIEKSSFIANEVRNASHNLSPLMLERFGLEESISQFLTQINKTTNCNFQLDIIGNLDLIDKNLNIVLFQIIQECIQNILKHAFAKNTIIQILNEPESIQLFIEDDGIGFDLDHVKYGLGLDSIKKLIEYKQGVFRIVSEKTKGVKIYVELPNQSN